MYLYFEIEKVGAIKCAIEKKRSTEELHKVSESIFKFIMKYFYTHFSGGRIRGQAKHRRKKICTNYRISVSFALLYLLLLKLLKSIEIEIEIDGVKIK